MNKWKEVAELFGLELEEEFKVQGIDMPSMIHKFTDRGLYEKPSNMWIESDDNCVWLIVNGDLEVIKLPWKPKYGDRYWTVFVDATSDNKLCVGSDFWSYLASDYAKWKIGICFKTKKEAEEKGIPLMQKIIEEFEIG